MTALLATFLTLSAAGNIVLVWYVRRIIKNFNNGIKGVDEFQELLDEYAATLSSMAELDQYYGDETVATAVKNTKMVVEACKFYKKSILDIEEEANIVASETR